MTVSLTFMMIGDDENPRWVVRVWRGREIFGDSQHCCESGHDQPEEAAAHGALLAVAWMGQQARDLRPPALGALALAKAQAA